MEYRRIFDPRLTEEYQVRGAGWVKKNADGELAAIAIVHRLGNGQPDERAGRPVRNTLAGQEIQQQPALHSRKPELLPRAGHGSQRH